MKEKLYGNYREKFLCLIKLLRKETNEHNTLSTQEIQKILAKENISIDRRTLSKEMKIIESLDFPVVSTKKSHQLAYYWNSGFFNEYELNLLINAVEAAPFISKKYSEKLKEKIKNQGKLNNCVISDTDLICYNINKHDNEELSQNLLIFLKCIENKHEASFNYFDYNEKGEKVYRKNKKQYVVCPVSLVYSDGFYYVICYNFKYKSSVTYRVDRCENLQEENIVINNEKALEFLNKYLPDENGETPKVDLKECVENYAKQAFKMYGGKINNNVRLEFTKSLLNTVFDKFGLKDKKGNKFKITYNEKEDLYQIVVNVQTGKTFWGWIAQFGGEMKVVNPPGCVKEYKEFCAKLQE